MGYLDFLPDSQYEEYKRRREKRRLGYDAGEVDENWRAAVAGMRPRVMLPAPPMASQPTIPLPPQGPTVSSGWAPPQEPDPGEMAWRGPAVVPPPPVPRAVLATQRLSLSEQPLDSMTQVPSAEEMRAKIRAEGGVGAVLPPTLRAPTPPEPDLQGQPWFAPSPVRSLDAIRESLLGRPAPRRIPEYAAPTADVVNPMGMLQPIPELRGRTPSDITPLRRPRGLEPSDNLGTTLGLMDTYLNKIQRPGLETLADVVQTPADERTPNPYEPPKPKMAFPQALAKVVGEGIQEHRGSVPEWWAEQEKGWAERPETVPGEKGAYEILGDLTNIPGGWITGGGRLAANVVRGMVGKAALEQTGKIAARETAERAAEAALKRYSQDVFELDRVYSPQEVAAIWWSAPNVQIPSTAVRDASMEVMALGRQPTGREIIDALYRQIGSTSDIPALLREAGYSRVKSLPPPAATDVQPSKVATAARAAASAVARAMNAEENPMLRQLAPGGTIEDVSAQSKVPTFYSALERAIDAKMPNRAAPEQIRGILQSGGVKPDEIKWTGFDDFLNERMRQGKPVTKQEALEYVRANQVQIKEVTKVGLTDAEQSEFTRLGFSDEVTPSQEARYQELKARAAAPIRYGQWVLPGGKNYRELLLTLPVKNDELPVPIGFTIQQNPNGQWDVIIDRLNAVMNTHPTRQEAVMAARRHAGWQENGFEGVASANPNVYLSSHWNEPNVLAHVRFNDRTAADGKKVLFLEEVQSDWHQTGRQKGYRTTERAEQALVAEDKGGYWEVRTDDGRFVTNAMPYDGVRNEAEAIVMGRRRLAEGNITNLGRDETVPPAPFAKTWPDLVLKRMIRYASENGYDEIAWTTGKQQTKRYDLAKQVEQIVSTRFPDGTYKITAIRNAQPLLDKSNLSPQEVAEIVGKDLAIKIVAAPEGISKWEGVDLAIGGEGMDVFYDQMLPEIANKLGKKFGARVTKADIPVSTLRSEGPHEGGFYVRDVDNDGLLPDGHRTRAGAEQEMARLRNQYGGAWQIEQIGQEIQETAVVQSLSITPALKRAALSEGFPLYSPPEAGGSVVGAVTGAVTADEDATPQEVAQRVLLGAAGGYAVGGGLRAAGKTLASKGKIGPFSEKLGAMAEGPDVFRSTGKERPATGLTKAQEAYLTNKLEDVAPKLPGQLSTGEQAAYMGNEAKGIFPKAPTGGVTIKIPDDGSVTVHSAGQANNLHYRLTGSPIKGMDKPIGIARATGAYVSPTPSYATHGGRKTIAESAELNDELALRQLAKVKLVKGDIADVKTGTVGNREVWTNGYILEVGAPPSKATITTTNFDMGKVMPEAVKPARVLGTLDNGNLVVFGAEDGTAKAAIDGKYYGYFVNKYGNDLRYDIADKGSVSISNRDGDWVGLSATVDHGNSYLAKRVHDKVVAKFGPDVDPSEAERLARVTDRVTKASPEELRHMDEVAADEESRRIGQAELERRRTVAAEQPAPATPPELAPAAEAAPVPAVPEPALAAGQQEMGVHAAPISKEPWAMTRDEAAGEPVSGYIQARRTSREGGKYELYYTGTANKVETTANQLYDTPVQAKLDYKLRAHKTQVERALAEGRPVPDAVLADYPDLAAKYGKAAEPSVGKSGPVESPVKPTVAEAPLAAPVSAEAVPSTVGQAQRLVEEAPIPVKAPTVGKRFDAGKKLTAEQRKAVVRSIVDVYKAKHAPRVLKGIDRSGEEIIGYEYSPDLFEKSDITGKGVRYYITLPDGSRAHPSELYPELTDARIANAIEEEQLAAKRLAEETSDLQRRRDARVAPADLGKEQRADANQRYNSTGRPIAYSYFAQDKSGSIVRVDGMSKPDVDYYTSKGFTPITEPVKPQTKDVARIRQVIEANINDTPPEVLADYPDLAARYGKVAEPSVGKAGPVELPPELPSMAPTTIATDVRQADLLGGDGKTVKEAVPAAFTFDGLMTRLNAATTSDELAALDREIEDNYDAFKSGLDYEQRQDFNDAFSTRNTGLKAAEARSADELAFLEKKRQGLDWQRLRAEAIENAGTNYTASARQAAHKERRRLEGEIAELNQQIIRRKAQMVESAAAKAAAPELPAAVAPEALPDLADLPPVQPGFIRLYRGGPRSSSERFRKKTRQGLWFIDTPEEALEYAYPYSDTMGELLYVDVPTGIVEPNRVPLGSSEVGIVLPREWAEKAVPMALPPEPWLPILQGSVAWPKSGILASVSTTAAAATPPTAAAPSIPSPAAAAAPPVERPPVPPSVAKPLRATEPPAPDIAPPAPALSPFQSKELDKWRRSVTGNRSASLQAWQAPDGTVYAVRHTGGSGYSYYAIGKDGKTKSGWPVEEPLPNWTLVEDVKASGAKGTAARVPQEAPSSAPREERVLLGSGKSDVPPPTEPPAPPAGLPLELPSGRKPGGPANVKPLEPGPSGLERLNTALEPEPISLPDKLRNAYQKAVVNFIDPKDPLKAISSEGAEAYKLARVAEGAVAAGEDIINTDWLPVIKGWTNKDIDALERYMVLMRERDILAFNPHARLPVSKGWGDNLQTVEQFRRLVGPERFKRIQTTAAKFYRLNKETVLQPLVDDGLMTKERLTATTSKHPHYIDFGRADFDDEVVRVAKQMGLADVSGPGLKEMSIGGSRRRLDNPLVNTLAQVVRVQQLIKRNRVANAIVDGLIEQQRKIATEIGTRLEDVPRDPTKVREMLAKSRNVPIEKVEREQPLVWLLKEGEEGEDSAVTGLMHFMRNGEAYRAQVPPSIAAVAKSLDTEGADALTRFFRTIGTPLRAGATQFNVEFIYKNPMRDIQQAWIYEGLRPLSAPFIKGWISAITKDQAFHEAARGGALMSGLVEAMRTRDALKSAARLGEYRVRNWKDVALLIPRLIEKANVTAEQATKLGVYHKLKGVDKLTELDRLVRTRDSTGADFSQLGNVMRLVNGFIPFTNAALQGSVNTLKLIAKNPKRAMIAATPLSMVSIGTYLWNQRFDTAKDIPDYYGSVSWPIIIGEGVRAPDPQRPNAPPEKYPIFIPIPKGPTGAILTAPVELALRLAWKLDNRSIAEIFMGAGVDTLARGLVPVDIGVGGALPPLAQTAVGVATNTDLFRGQKVVPAREEGRPPEWQFGPETSSAAVAIGQKFKVSPRMIDFAIKDYLAGVGQQGLWASDLALRALGYDPEAPGGIKARGLTMPEKLGQAPITRAFVRTSSNQQDELGWTHFNKAVEESKRTLWQNPEMRRLGINIGAVSDRLSLPEDNALFIILTPEERAELQRANTSFVSEAVQRVFQLPQYAKVTDDLRIKGLQQEMDKAREKARIAYISHMDKDELRRRVIESSPRPVTPNAYPANPQ